MTESQGRPPRVLIVDDEPAAARLLSRILARQGFVCATAVDADRAKKAMEREDFDLVLTDMDMPGQNGLDLIGELRSMFPDTATVMVTGRGSTEIGNEAVERGAYGYITKPINRDELVVNVSNAVRRRELEIENRRHRTELESMVERRTSALWEANVHLARSEEELRVSREETIRRLAIAAELRDDETARHVERVSRYTALLTDLVLDDPVLTEELRLASALHDVGKLGIPDRILLKVGQLTPVEYETMKGHANLGYQILAGSGSGLLEQAATISRTHHERFDGSGYPRGLAGIDIPLEGRIVAVADVFDALTTHRVYRAAYPLVEALEIMREGRGTHFDPELLDLFLGSMPDVLDILNGAPARGDIFAPLPPDEIKEGAT